MAEVDHYLDEDTTDAYLELPQPRYAPDGKPAPLSRVDDLLDAAARGEIELPKLPPPVDH